MKLAPFCILSRCFLRTYTVSAAYNSRGLQNIGFIHALNPGLETLYKEPQELKTARQRYVRHYNSHPFWAPLIVGIFLHMEYMHAKGHIPAKAITGLKETTNNALSAIGDSVFNGSMGIAWALFTACLVLAGMCKTALALGIVLFAALHILRLVSFWGGLTRGIGVLSVLRRYDLINLGDTLKIFNAFLMAVFLSLASPGLSSLNIGASLIFLLAFAWLSGKMHFPRFIAVFFFVTGTYILYSYGRALLDYLQK